MKWPGSLLSYEQILTPSPVSDGAARDKFGSAVSIDGNTVLIGASEDTDDGQSGGSAYVYVRSGDTWLMQAKLTAESAIGVSDVNRYDSFGFSVSLDGDTALIGATSNEGTGSVYVYVRTDEVWRFQAKLKAESAAGVSDAENGDSFGVSVSIDGNTALIGAYGDGYDNHNYGGSAYVYIRSGTTWAFQSKLVPESADGVSDAAAFYYFGSSVSLDGDTALIGAEGGNDGGAAYVYERNGSTWSFQAKLTAESAVEVSDASPGDAFGHSVSIDGNTALIAAHRDDYTQGSVYIYARDGTTWESAQS